MSATSAPIDQNAQSGKSVESSEHYGNPRDNFSNPRESLGIGLSATSGKKYLYAIA